MKNFEFVNKAEIPTNAINYKEFAHLGVNLAYKTDYTSRYLAEALTTDGIHLVGSGFEILAASCDNANTAQYGYKAVAFINKETKVVHIASAGTKADMNDVWDDALIVLRYAPNKLKTAQKFVDEVIKKIGGIEKAAEYIFETSGHSLGAIVADLTGVELHSRNLNFNKSVTFDSPGSQEVIKYAINQDLFTGKVITPLEELAKHSEIYNAKPNVINTTNSHAGKINLVLPKVNNIEKSESSKAEGWGTYLYNMVEGLNNHKLKNFADLKDHAVLPIADWKEQILENNEDTQKLKAIPSSGKDVYLLDTTRITDDEYTSIVGVDVFHWAYNDLQQSCAMEVEQIGNINNNLISMIC
ncbi:lipase family protein [Rickettsia hoogstraalii str. RCCE3]|nr:lipase family protein [Rickettsia hoogstraalii str. RCCE3]